MREDLARYQAARPCQDCGGSRLRREARHVFLTSANARGPALFEVFGKALSSEMLDGCASKRFAKKDWLRVEATRKGLASPVEPRVWVIGPSVQADAVERYGLRRMKGWPKGCLQSVTGLGLFVVSLGEVPRTRKTLLLRLLAGRTTVFRQAIEDLMKLPANAWEREAVKHVLLARREEIGQSVLTGSAADEAEELAMDVQKLYQQWENRVLERGLKKGLNKGLDKGLILIYRARFKRVPAAIAKTIRNIQDADKLEAWYPVFSTRSASDIAAALGVGRTRPA